MLSSFNNPWFSVVVDPLWSVRQTTQTVAKCVAPELLSDPQALTDYLLDPSEHRLNPFDLHGRRRPARAASGDEHVAVSRSRIKRRAS